MNIFQSQKKWVFEIAGSFFQVLLSTIFYKRSGTFNETFLTLSSLPFSQKNSWFLFLDKSQVQKSVGVITWFPCSLNKQKFKNIQAHGCIPLPFQYYHSLSVWCVCFVYLHHFYSIICVSQEELSFIASNEQICTFYKWVIF